MIEKNKKICVCYSGGKNSSVALMEYARRGYKNLEAVCYIPFFDEETPFIDREHLNFIYKQKKFFLKEYGVNINIVKGVTFFDWCARKLVKGKDKGLEYGLPLPIRGKCGFARDGKIKACNDYIKSKNFDFIDIGICFDEMKDRKKLTGKEVSILQELEIKDKDCFKIARDYVILSPKYEKGTRDGCMLCPNAKKEEHERFLLENPQVFDKLLILQRFTINRGYYPLRYKKFIIENEEFISKGGNQLDLLRSYSIN